MIRAKSLTAGQRAELDHIVRRPGEDHGVARRTNAILLLDDGKSCALIAEFLYLDDDTIRNWYDCPILAFLREDIPKEWHSFGGKVTVNFRIISHKGFRV